MSAASPAARAPADLLRLVEERSGQNVFACYQCGKCTAGCPFSLAPQRVMRLLQLGQVEEAMEHPTTWECASCYTCETGCPKGLSPALVHRTLRAVSGNGHARGRRRLRTWMFTHVSEVWRAGTVLGPLARWAARLPGAGLVNEVLLGVDHHRPLPPLAHPTFPRWFARRAPGGDGHRGRAVLFHDTFMDYNYPAVGMALTDLLERAGYRVELADMVCCGRPAISKALLDLAAERARTNVTRLFEQVRDGAPIVGCEPSCLLSLREEYPQLVELPLREKARRVAERARLADELLAGLAGDGELEVTFRPREEGPRPVLFHAHCHQKASARPEASLELLRLAGYDAELLDGPCCGMAGSYGFEKEHYEASRRAGDRALFPLLRERPDAVVAITGTSCRQQIEHFTGRPTRHVVELLREAAV